jgi:rhamnosyltransferase
MRTDQPLLTIAIPTFNRAAFLRELLASLQPQLEEYPQIELLISDNACTDDTASVIAEFVEHGLALRHLRNESNIGPDANFLQCYEQAAGRYVWVFGDDDLVLDGGIAKVVRLLEREAPDYMFVAPYIFLQSIVEIRPTRKIVPTQLVTSAEKMATLVNLHADLILITSAILNKDWIASLAHPQFASLVETNLVQLGWVLTCLRYLRRGVFVELGVLATRGANSRGGFRAAKVFGESYRRAIGEMLGQDKKLIAKLLGDHMRFWFPRNWLGFREDGEDAERQNEILSGAFRESPWYWVCAWPLMHAPIPIAEGWARVLRGVARIQLNSLKATTGARKTVALANARNGLEQTGRVAAVVVLFHPDLNLLERLLNSVIGQVQGIVAVDNTPDLEIATSRLLHRFGDQVTYISLGQNTGIAAAQNAGIRAVSGAHYSHVLLLDQDSCPEANMVDELLSAEMRLVDAGARVAAVGPKFIDEKNGTVAKAIQHKWMRVKKVPVDGIRMEPVEADYLIASGSLIHLSTLAEVGAMREELFIDWVDIEWGLRARQAGSQCYVIPTAVMKHSIGDEFVRVLDKDINLHNDIRNYYIVRNATYLLRLRSMGWQWRSCTLFKIPLYVVFYSWNAGRTLGKRWASFRLLCTACLDGVRGRLGRLERIA